MRNRNRIVVIFAFLLAIAPLSSRAQKPVVGKGKAPMAYEAFFKNEMRKQEGVFPVYQNGQKYYLEIPASALGRDLLVSGRVVRGGHYGEVSSVSSLLTFDLGRDNTLEVRQLICSDRAEGELAGAVEASGMRPVKMSFPIAAFGKGKQGYILDITSDLKSSGKLFAFPNQKFVNSPVANRSGVDSIYMIRDGVKFVALHAQSDVIPGMLHIPPRDVHTTVLIEWSLQLLPERHVVGREADSRVGYNTIAYNDYDRNPYGVEKVREIRRWNLEVRPEDADRYWRGELVEPANPIGVYLDSTLSGEWTRRAVLRAVEEWNACFEAAGFKNALQVWEGEPEVSLAYHQIVFSYVMGRPQFTQIGDPRTGEILSGAIGISYQDEAKELTTVAMMAGGYEPAALTDSLPVVREEYIRYKASNLLGQMLGLVPNWGGSAAFTTEQLRDAAWVREHGIASSVTDGCVVNYAAQPGDGMTLADLFSKASDYDRWAVEWGYRRYADAESERKALRELLARSKDNAALYFTTKGRDDYRAVETDLGQNVVETAELGVRNMARLAPRVSDIFVNELSEDNEPWVDYIRFVGEFDMLHNNYVNTVLNYIGAMSVEPIIAGYNDVAMKFLPKERTQEAVAFLNRNVFQLQPEWRNDSLYVEMIGINKEMKSNGQIMATAKRLMNETVLQRLMLAEAKEGGSVYTLRDLFGAIDRYVFLNYSATKPLRRNQVLLQYNLIREFATVCGRIKAKDGYGDLAFGLMNWGYRMNDKLAHLAKNHRDARTRSYYRGLNVYLTRALKTGKANGFMDQMMGK